jgi:type III restriction enzyme
MLAVEIEHQDIYQIEDAAKIMRLFLREKDPAVGAAWPKKRLVEFIKKGLEAGGYDSTFLSKENLLLLQQSFSPMFRGLDQEHPRMSQVAKEIVPVDLATVSGQSISESMLREHGAIWHAGNRAPFEGQEAHLWDQYQRYCKQFKDYGDEAADAAKAIAARIQQVDLTVFRSPWNIIYASHEPEQQFSKRLFDNAKYFDSFVRMPNQGIYSFPYSYKPAKTGKTHTANENFNPDYFIKLKNAHDIMVVEIKADGDDTNRNRAKWRDGKKHFETLNTRLTEAGEPWRYHFFFLSPEDYSSFFEATKAGNLAWKSGLMQDLDNA